MKLENFEILPSTQDYIKERRAFGQNLIVTAKRQTGGKGTKGRSFSSNEGGVYLSKLTFHENFPAKEAFKIMAGAAVAICETLCCFELAPVIKWPNDIFVNGKKICGILIENVFSGKYISSSIVGVGLNVNNELPSELAEIATSMQMEAKKTFSVDEVRDCLIEELSLPRDMKEYLAYLGYMGREATLLMGDERVHGTLLFVDTEGGLTVEINGEKRRLTAAEVSIRL